MIKGIDISSHQDPAKFDWPGLVASGVKFVIARAAYGTKLDADFKKYADLSRAHGLEFGAYLFYRQTQSVTDQLAAWNRQIGLIGGLGAGDVYPTLDMEHNAVNGDGEPIASKFSSACREIAEAFATQYGGAILYYSSYFPEYLGARTRPGQTLWMKTGYKHWLADYGDKKVQRPAAVPGKVRTPYTPEWHIHQYTGFGRLIEYAQGGADIDLNVVNPATDFNDLIIDAPIEVSDDARDDEILTTVRPGGCDIDPAAIDLIEEGLRKIREGLDVIDKE